MQKRKTPNSAFLFLAESKGVFAFDTLSWRNVETVHRTVSLSLLSSLCSEFAPIFGSNPLVEINKKRKVAPWGYHFLFLKLTPNFNTIVLSGAFVLKEKFHDETFLFTPKFNTRFRL